MLKNNIVKFWKSFIFIGVLFFYVYNIKFVFFPITTNILYSIFGLFLFVYLLLCKKIYILKNSIVCIILVCLIFIQSLLSIFINSTYEIGFLIKEFIPNIVLPFFGALFIAYIGRNTVNSISALLKAFVIVTFIQSLLCISGFFFLSFGDFLTSLQVIPDRLSRVYDEGRRAFGLGSGFDIGAFTISYSLLITSYFFITCKQKFEALLFLIFSIQTLAGLLMARSIIIGWGLSCIFILIVNKERRKKKVFVFLTLSFCILLLVLLFVFFPTVIENNYKTVVWMFEFFIDSDQLNKGGGGNSLTVLFGEMYFLPELKTWFLGDGRYLSTSGSIYKNTDPLYMRYLLFFGLPGLLLVITYNISLIRKVFFIQNDIAKKEHVGQYKHLIVFVLIQSLIIYVKLNAHFYFLVYYMIWFMFFDNSSTYKSKAKISNF